MGRHASPRPGMGTARRGAPEAGTGRPSALGAAGVARPPGWAVLCAPESLDLSGGARRALGSQVLPSKERADAEPANDAGREARPLPARTRSGASETFANVLAPRTRAPAARSGAPCSPWRESLSRSRASADTCRLPRGPRRAVGAVDACARASGSLGRRARPQMPGSSWGPRPPQPTPRPSACSPRCVVLSTSDVKSPTSQGRARGRPLGPPGDSGLLTPSEAPAEGGVVTGPGVTTLEGGPAGQRPLLGTPGAWKGP